MSNNIPQSHPRYQSLITRENLVKGMRNGLVHETGLIAHGRGEAFDYLLGETTQPFAVDAIRAAAASLLLAKHPIISVNGNVAALAAKECVHLATALSAALEVNLFHRSEKRIELIQKTLQQHGATTVLGNKGDAIIPGLDHGRARCDSQGIYQGDVILVPLEDGDRCQALRNMGKTVITIDLNPLSRTAKTASITIVDNVIRAVPCLTTWITIFKQQPEDTYHQLPCQWNNTHMLQQSLAFIAKRINS